jgi:23S rRNA pseudoU1915 N3-methylase RlmH
VPRSVEATDLNYLKKEDYGKTPSYLTKVKEEIRRENEMIDKYVKEQLGEVEREPEQFEQMDEYERQDLIQALKNKWDAVNAKYQKITHLVRLDTTGQVRRKEQLENELQTIERDIEKLSRHSTVLIREG